MIRRIMRVWGITYCIGVAVVGCPRVVGGATVVGACRTPATSSIVNTDCSSKQGPHAHLPILKARDEQLAQHGPAWLLHQASESTADTLESKR